MSDEPQTPNPYTGLDKALLRQTQSPAGEARQSRPERVASRPTGIAGERPTDRASERTADRPPTRDITRSSFEFYRDQIERLRRISLEDKLNGGTRSMSEMVREAVDRYLGNECTPDRATDRPGEPPDGRPSGY